MHPPDPLDTFEDFERFTHADIPRLTREQAIAEARDCYELLLRLERWQVDWRLHGIGQPTAQEWLRERTRALLIRALTRAA